MDERSTWSGRRGSWPNELPEFADDRPTLVLHCRCGCDLRGHRRDGDRLRCRLHPTCPDWHDGIRAVRDHELQIDHVVVD